MESVTGITNELILIGILIIIGLPLLNYNFRLLIVIIFIYLLVFPERRNLLYNTFVNEKTKKELSSGDADSSKSNVLYQEGTQLIKELKKYRKDNQTVYLSIKISWKKFMKLSDTLLNNDNITYPHHIFSSLLDQKKYILNQMSSIIINLEPLNLHETTLTKERTLPLDVNIRVIIRKMSVILDYILNIIKNKINNRWYENPYTELSPIDYGGAQAYNQNKLDIII